MGWNRVETLASALYGIVLSTAVAGAYSESEELSNSDIAIGVLVTALVFWLAHVYVGVLARLALRDEQVDWAATRNELIEEVPIVAGALPVAGMLLLAPLGVLSDQGAETAAIATGIGLLTLGGVTAGLRRRLPLLGVVLIALASSGLGFLIVGLKALVH